MTADDSLPELQVQEATGRAKAVTAAEELLLEKVKTGDAAFISDRPPGFVPFCWPKSDTIRADFLRHLCLNPEPYAIDPQGIRLWGALITGELNLTATTLERPLWVFKSRFDATPMLHGATTRTLGLHACQLPGFQADRLTVSGMLRFDDSTFSGTVSLGGADIIGVLGCNNAIFENAGGEAFNADGLKTGGTVFFNTVTVWGETRLLGADIGGDLECNNASFINADGYAFNASGLKVGGCVFLRDVTARGMTALSGADISGNLECDNVTFGNNSSEGFNGERMRVQARFFWSGFAKPPQGNVDIRHAKVGDFVDDGSGSPVAGKLLIDGFQYENLALPTSAADRIKWLSLMPTDHKDKPVFWPQPYEQLIKVFRKAGHERDARQIAIAKQDALYDHLIRQAKDDDVTTWHRRWGMLFLKFTAGYGYRPSNALWISLFFLCVGTLIFEAGQIGGYVLPAKDLAYMNKCYPTPGDPKDLDCKVGWRDYSTVRRYAPGADNALRLCMPDWFMQGAQYRLPEDYVTFNAIAYSVDVFVPILDLQQETSWMPKEGWFRFYMWLHIIFGWVFTTIAVAGFSGLLKKNDK